MREFMKKASLSTIANFFVLIVSVFSTLIFPKVLNINDYSYWQLYVFYTNYVTIAGLGIVEGVYLLNGGKRYDELKSEELSFCSYFLAVVTILIFGIIFVLSLIFIKDSMTKIVIFFACIEGIVFNIRVFPLFIFQAVDKIKEFSFAIFLGRLIFIILSILVMCFDVNKLYLFMLSDIIGCIICALYSYRKCHDKILVKPCKLAEGIVVAKKTIKIGIKLLIATLIGTGILGVFKYFIKSGWDIIAFGKISLVLTFTNVFLRFATSVGQVLFPTLCNFSKEKLKSMFITLTKVVDIVIGLVFVLYYPVKEFMIFYLPEYAETLNYMGLLLPICLFEAKVSLIFNTYCKALRKEKHLMNINIFIFILSLILCIIFSLIIKNLNICIFCILLVLALRSIILEMYVSKRILGLKMQFGFDSLLISLIFITSNYFIGGIKGFILYMCLILLYLIFNLNFIKNKTKVIKKKS